MNSNIRSLSFVILFASLSAISALGIIHFLNNAYADNVTMSDNMNMSTNMPTKQNKTLSDSMSVNTNGTTNMTNMTNMNTNKTATNMNTNETMTNMPKTMSPLQQFKSGISATSVKCNDGFTLVIKIEDGSPACVTSQVAQSLIVRGWGTTS